MKIAIVGSEEKHWNHDQKRKVMEHIKYTLKQENTTLVSGGCHKGGPDIWAEAIAIALDVETEIYLPDEYVWSIMGSDRRGFKERNKQIEADKRSTLKPYVLLAFVWSVLIALTTSIVAITIFVLTQITAPGGSPAMLAYLQQQILMFSIGIIFQCWMSGFFIGKISEGTFAAGFKYSAMLAVTAYISLFLSQNYLMTSLGVIPG